jgi:glycosyltransferase involved in cell wall biosynthesis
MQEVIINARFLTQPITGVQRYATELSKILKEQIPGVKFVSPNGIIQKELASYLEVETFGSFSGHRWEQLELPVFLRKSNSPLLINLCNTAPLFYKNQIVTIHDISFLINPKWFSKSFYIYYSFLIPRIARNAKKILTPSKYSKSDLIKVLQIPKDNIEVAYNSIPDSFRKLDTARFNNKYGRYILAVSSLDPRKNFKNLIIAFNKANLIDTKLVIVGTQHKTFANQELKGLIKDNSSIIFTGYVSDEDLKSLYVHADLFLYPSLYEGFGIPPLEAMACGCPTIVSNTSSLPEVCGEASYYINPEDVEQIADAIVKLSVDETYRNHLRVKGLERVEYFSWHRSATKVINIIDSLIYENSLST